MTANNFQRIGSLSNAHEGTKFEDVIRDFFSQQGISLQRNFSTAVGVGSKKKNHRFDLGSDNPPLLVECKSHTWTEGGNVPSAKMTLWNEAMYYFYVAPEKYRKVLFVLKHTRRDVSLASYYLGSYGHLIPTGVEIWEYCNQENKGERVH